MRIFNDFFAKLYKVLFPFGFRPSVHTYYPSVRPPTHELFNVASVFRPGQNCLAIVYHFIHFWGDCLFFPLFIKEKVYDLDEIHKNGRNDQTLAVFTVQHSNLYLI